MRNLFDSFSTQNLAQTCRPSKAEQLTDMIVKSRIINKEGVG